jgi:hypothetical protein
MHGSLGLRLIASAQRCSLRQASQGYRTVRSRAFVAGVLLLLDLASFRSFHSGWEYWVCCPISGDSLWVLRSTVPASCRR